MHVEGSAHSAGQAGGKFRVTHPVNLMGRRFRALPVLVDQGSTHPAPLPVPLRQRGVLVEQVWGIVPKAALEVDTKSGRHATRHRARRTYGKLHGRLIHDDGLEHDLRSSLPKCGRPRYRGEQESHADHGQRGGCRGSTVERGFVVDVVSDGKDGLVRAMAEDYDIAVIDRMLPGLDGLSIVAALRRAGNQTPVLFLTAMGAVEDRVAGLRGGGDDYLVKPFAFSELHARIDALLRRRAGGGAAPTTLELADLEMDMLARTVTRAGRAIELQPRPVNLLLQVMVVQYRLHRWVCRL